MTPINHPDARSKFPEAFKLLDQENRMQHPDAVFLRASFGEHAEDGFTELEVWYILSSGEKLWTTSVIDNLDGNASIDEYYVRDE